MVFLFKCREMTDRELLRVVVGSQAQGLATPTSDTDYIGLYIEPMKDIATIGSTKFYERGVDFISYEVGRFVELLNTANPTALEVLYIPEPFIIKKDPRIQPLIDNRDMFLTKRCKDSFGGYIRAQIRKAIGTNKKVNWEHRNVSEKTILDFCQVIDFSDRRSMPIDLFLKKWDLKEENIGLSKINKMKGCYYIYYDYTEYLSEAYRPKEYKFRGLLKKKTKGHQLRLSSIPKGLAPIGLLNYNQEGYSSYTREFREYTEWLNNRNKDRYIETPKEGQSINAKNLMHCRRLLDVAKEVAETGTMTVWRENREDLLDIRAGKFTLEDLLESLKEDEKNLDQLFENSSLPDRVDMDLAKDILWEIRKSFKEDFSV